MMWRTDCLCLFVAMFSIFTYHLPHHLLPKLAVLLLILSSDYPEGPPALLSSSSFITALLLSLPCLAHAYALAKTVVSLEKRFLNGLNCPCILSFLQMLFPGPLTFSTALDVLKLRSIIFEIQHPKLAWSALSNARYSRIISHFVGYTCGFALLRTISSSFE